MQIKPHSVLQKVTDQIIARSDVSRSAYLQRMSAAKSKATARGRLGCGNLAHTFAGAEASDKGILKSSEKPNIAIVTAYNDMLSAHKPYENYPQELRAYARELGAVAQVAGGVPAMCDGITQGYEGMELSLFSRDVIAMSTGLALSHNTFDAALALGICDKIIPGLFMGACSFGHLPWVFVPAGPMSSGLPNKQKAHIRQLFAEGKVSREELLEAEAQSYHSEGTCTFYGTANSNQMLMEIMGLQIPGGSFVNPKDSIRKNLNRLAVERVLALSEPMGEGLALCDIVDEKTFVNAIVGLLASGGSTNHTIHLIAMAKSAGIHIDWSDFSELSKIIPLVCRIYPNGEADVNHFHAAGGMGFLVQDLLSAGLLHENVQTIMGQGLRNYTQEAYIEKSQIHWRPAVTKSLDESVLRSVRYPFSEQGGMTLLEGNLGRGILKISAVKTENHIIEAPAVVFYNQNDVLRAFKNGLLQKDVVVVLKNQGPAANGMPELHKLTPALGSLQDQGFRVALVTDGRMSGASGKVPAAIHVSPECILGGDLDLVQDGDMIRVDGVHGQLLALVDATEWSNRKSSYKQKNINFDFGSGREMFFSVRQHVTSAEEGASFLFLSEKKGESRV